MSRQLKKPKAAPAALRHVEKRCAYCEGARGDMRPQYDGRRGWHWCHSGCRRSYVGGLFAAHPTPAQQAARDDFAQWQRDKATRAFLLRMQAAPYPVVTTEIPPCFDMEGSVTPSPDAIMDAINRVVARFPVDR